MIAWNRPVTPSRSSLEQRGRKKKKKGEKERKEPSTGGRAALFPTHVRTSAHRDRDGRGDRSRDRTSPLPT